MFCIIVVLCGLNISHAQDLNKEDMYPWLITASQIDEYGELQFPYNNAFYTGDIVFSADLGEVTIPFSILCYGDLFIDHGTIPYFNDTVVVMGDFTSKDNVSFFDTAVVCEAFDVQGDVTAHSLIVPYTGRIIGYLYGSEIYLGKMEVFGDMHVDKVIGDIGTLFVYEDLWAELVDMGSGHLEVYQYARIQGDCTAKSVHIFEGSIHVDGDLSVAYLWVARECEVGGNKIVNERALEGFVY
jgi:cytoskeletal protein CcmA (bactofilin family)